MNSSLIPPSTANKAKPCTIVIAGNDSSGMAGIARDTQTLFALGVHAKPIITACTAQNSEGLHDINPVNQTTLESQWRAIGQDQAIGSIKIGLLCSAAQVNFLVASISDLNIPIVVDPVLSASSGERFGGDELIASYRNQLVPIATLVSPNLDEAAAICGFIVRSHEDMLKAANKILKLGAKAVLIKGGHMKPEESASSQDLFCSDTATFWLSSPRVATRNNRGTGCTLASSIAAAIAKGYSIEDAVVIGKMAINQGLRTAYEVGLQAGPVAPKEFPCEQRDLPCLFKQYGQQQSVAFRPITLPSGETRPLGLYPVVDSAKWIERLVSLGVSTIQLRVKNLCGEALAQEIGQAVAIAEENNCRLFINDHWQLAIKHKAYGVHLGQEDLDDANVDAIQQAGLRLGISTHCHFEVARAHSYQPSYIACGPVFHTNTKLMPWTPHGPEGFAYWRKVLGYPLVAIGGINQERIPSILDQKADGIALITAISQAADPEGVTKKFLTIVNDAQASPNTRFLSLSKKSTAHTNASLR